MSLELLTFWIAMAFLSAFMADRKNRNPFLWAFLGFLLGIFAPIILLFKKKIETGNSEARTENS